MRGRSPIPHRAGAAFRADWKRRGKRSGAAAGRRSDQPRCAAERRARLSRRGAARRAVEVLRRSREAPRRPGAVESRSKAWTTRLPSVRGSRPDRRVIAMKDSRKKVWRPRWRVRFGALAPQRHDVERGPASRAATARRCPVPFVRLERERWITALGGCSIIARASPGTLVPADATRRGQARVPTEAGVPAGIIFLLIAGPSGRWLLR